jgi:hypothetical protein
MPVYSEDRVTRLRLVLWVVVGVGVLVALLAALTLADGKHPAAGVVALVIAAALLGSSGWTLRLLPAGERPAKIAAVATGVLCLVCGLLAGSWVAFVLLVVGLGVLFLALLPDDPEGGAR